LELFNFTSHGPRVPRLLLRMPKAFSPMPGFELGLTTRLSLSNLSRKIFFVPCFPGACITVVCFFFVLFFLWSGPRLSPFFVCPGPLPTSSFFGACLAVGELVAHPSSNDELCPFAAPSRFGISVVTCYTTVCLYLLLSVPNSTPASVFRCLFSLLAPLKGTFPSSTK